MREPVFVNRDFGSESQNVMSAWDIAEGSGGYAFSVVDRGSQRVVAMCHTRESAERIIQQLKEHGYVEE